MRPNPRRIAPIILLLVIVAVAAWYFTQGGGGSNNTGELAASGTIEGTQIVIAPEVGGRVLEVLAREGDTVQAGQELVRFDDALLKAQLSQAHAALQTAQANYDLVARGPTEEQRQLAIASAQSEEINARQALQALYDNAGLSAAQLQQNIAATDKSRDKAQQYLDNITSLAATVDVEAAWASVVISRDQLEKAQEDFQPYQNKDQGNVTRAVMQAKLAAAQKQYDSAVERYNNLVGTANQYELAVARADLMMEEAELADLQRQYRELRAGIDPKALALAEARLKTASANLAAARAGTSPEELAVARAQVETAQAALEVIQAQIAKLSITAPVDGVILTRTVEPGEVLVPGAPLLTLIQLKELTITVYVPEDRYGTIRLGQAATVTADSFPGESFRAQVIRIADQAEFTPRNVQTEAGRRTTVFAVDLAVMDTQAKLKPGMPADVDFLAAGR
ncbi:MAG TPA: HlyD family efflux transporter periplasmic adaptor subunit [Anaerolineales bacterium]|nr:HlyD family efflux transporter periplasmic adaptor subunit [Anaerolineales bacterium]